jgi:phage/plasmid-associated DNA primase
LDTSRTGLKPDFSRCREQVHRRTGPLARACELNRRVAEGAALYYHEGLGDPPDVKAATEQYRQESDRLQEFFEDKCILMPNGNADSWKRDRCWDPVSDLYAAYASWVEAMGHKYPLSKDSFDERLLKLGRKRDRVRPEGRRETKQVRAWLGIRFRTPEDD